jgi:hypothetical protein
VWLLDLDRLGEGCGEDGLWREREGADGENTDYKHERGDRDGRAISAKGPLIQRR